MILTSAQMAALPALKVRGFGSVHDPVLRLPDSRPSEKCVSADRPGISLPRKFSELYAESPLFWIFHSSLNRDLQKVKAL